MGNNMNDDDRAGILRHFNNVLRSSRGAPSPEKLDALYAVLAAARLVLDEDYGAMTELRDAVALLDET